MLQTRGYLNDIKKKHPEKFEIIAYLQCNMTDM